MCILHGSVGRRILKNMQAWKKKKDGTYGYITSKKVLYEFVRSTNLLTLSNLPHNLLVKNLVHLSQF